MKKLCFGSFVTVLVRCKPKRTAQKRLCGTILLSIAPKYDIREDDGATSGLVRGNDNLSPDVTSAMPTDNFAAVAAYFKRQVVPMLDSNKQNTIILALKEIVAEDESIQPTTVVEMVNDFSKADLAERSSFVFADFLAGLFLYTVANVGNRGCEESINELTDEYMQSLEPKKTNISILAAYSKLNVEFATDLAVEASEIAMLTETGGNCQKCGRPLGIKKEDESVSYAKRIHLSDADDILVCVNCEREMHTLTDAEKSQLISDKHSLEIYNTARDAISRHELEAQILEVLEAIYNMDDLRDKTPNSQPGNLG